MGTARLLLSRLKGVSSISSRLFSSSAALIRRPWTQFSDESEDSDGDGGSAVYKRALKLQRPSTVKYWENLHNHNSVSLIGLVEAPLRKCNTANGILGVYTFLKVKRPQSARHHFTMMLKFWDEMAEMSVQHLKQNDQVYVSGHLDSYMKADENGKFMHHYEVVVAEMNFIYQCGSDPASQILVNSDALVSTEDIMQMRRDRLRLWQIFFISPHEWWDNRNSKLNPNAPDFKHKDTGEALWLKDHDPPWIKKQLRLHDSRHKERSPGHSRLHLSQLVYDDGKGT